MAFGFESRDCRRFVPHAEVALLKICIEVSGLIPDMKCTMALQSLILSNPRMSVATWHY